MQKIVYVGQFNDSSGYGNAARNYLKCFDEFLDDYKDVIDFKIMPFNFENDNACNAEENTLISKYNVLDENNPTPQDLYDFLDADTKIITHLVPEMDQEQIDNPINPINVMLEAVGKENMYSSLAWEPNRLPQKWLKFYEKYFGHVIVYCDYTRQCFLSHGFEEDRVHLVPHPIFDIEAAESSTLNREVFEIFALSQWVERKGWDILVPAVCHEFFHHDDVQLTIKTFRYEPHGANPVAEKKAVMNEVLLLKNRINHYGKKSNVRINLTCGLTEKSLISDLFKRSAVYCLPTRCDSFGLTIGEAVIAKRCAIVPSLGGHRDYFKDDNPFLVDSSMQPLFIDLHHIGSTLDMQLVETDYNDLRAKLRKAYDMWKENPDSLAQIADSNFEYATSEVINNEKIFNKFLVSLGVNQ